MLSSRTLPNLLLGFAGEFVERLLGLACGLVNLSFSFQGFIAGRGPCCFFCASLELVFVRGHGVLLMFGCLLSCWRVSRIDGPSHTAIVQPRMMGEWGTRGTDVARAPVGFPRRPQS